MKINWEEEIKKQEREDQKILEQIKLKVDKNFFEEIKYNLKEEKCAFDFKITNKTLGKLQDKKDYKFTEEFYINQITNGGFTGDEFGGTCSIKISDNEYFQYSYSI